MTMLVFQNSTQVPGTIVHWGGFWSRSEEKENWSQSPRWWYTREMRNSIFHFYRLRRTLELEKWMEFREECGERVDEDLSG